MARDKAFRVYISVYQLQHCHIARSPLTSAVSVFSEPDIEQTALPAKDTANMGNPDKFRLYLAMYDNGKFVAPGDPPPIHWALMVGPKFEEPLSLLKTNVLYHATNRTRGGHWEFERREVECVRSRSMLGRILLGKILQRLFPP